MRHWGAPVGDGIEDGGRLVEQGPGIVGTGGPFLALLVGRVEQQEQQAPEQRLGATSGWARGRVGACREAE